VDIAKTIESPTTPEFLKCLLGDENAEECVDTLLTSPAPLEVFPITKNVELDDLVEKMRVVITARSSPCLSAKAVGVVRDLIVVPNTKGVLTIMFDLQPVAEPSNTRKQRATLQFGSIARDFQITEIPRKKWTYRDRDGDVRKLMTSSTSVATCLETQRFVLDSSD